MVEQRHGVGQRPCPTAGKAERSDVQLIDHQILDPGRHGQAGGELVGPELVVADDLGWRGRGLEVPAHDILVDHDAAAHPTVEGGRIPVPGTRAGIDASPADLPARVDVGAVDDLRLGVLDAVHVRRADVGREVLECRARPDARRPEDERDRRHVRVDALAVIADVAVVAAGENDPDAPGVGGPHRELQRWAAASLGDDLLGSEVPAVDEVVALLVLGAGAGEHEPAEALAGVGVGNLAVDRPNVGALRPVQADAPGQAVPGLFVVKDDRGGEGGAAVFPGHLRHRRLGPAVPAPGQAGVAEDPALLAGHVQEPHRDHPSASSQRCGLAPPVLPPPKEG